MSSETNKIRWLKKRQYVKNLLEKAQTNNYKNTRCFYKTITVFKSNTPNSYGENNNGETIMEKARVLTNSE